MPETESRIRAFNEWHKKERLRRAEEKITRREMPLPEEMKAFWEAHTQETLAVAVRPPAGSKNREETMNKIEYPIELIYWLDACGPDTVVTLRQDDIDALAPMCTADVGFVAAETDSYIVLAPQLNEECGFRRPICIPKVCIQKRIQLVGRRKR